MVFRERVRCGGAIADALAQFISGDAPVERDQAAESVKGKTKTQLNCRREMDREQGDEREGIGHQHRDRRDPNFAHLEIKDAAVFVADALDEAAAGNDAGIYPHSEASREPRIDR